MGYSRNYIRRYGEYSFEITPKGFPYIQNIDIYKGDEISIALKGINLDDDKDPFNFNVFDTFKGCFKMFPNATKEYCSISDNFILGQSQDALDYDAQQTGHYETTYDELHFIDSNYTILADYNFNKVFFDIQAEVSDSIYTLIRFKINITQDIT